MHPHARHYALLLTLLLAACGQSPLQHTAGLLNDRLQAQLAADVKAGQAAVQPLPNGARVTLLGPTLFPSGKMALDDKYPDVRADVIEGLLDPALMQVRVADTTTLPDDQRIERVANVRDYFADNGLANVLQPADPTQSPTNAGPAGLTITIAVQCPQRSNGIGYDGGLSKPVCE
jgi:hypothetical protein